MTTGQHQATGHLAATLVTTIIQTSELSINYVLPLQQRHGGLSRDQAEQWNILEVYPFISILDMELDMSRDELGSFILHKGANYLIVSLWVLTSIICKQK